MRFGCCTTIDNGSILAEAGYDFIELNVVRDLQPETSDEDWAPVRAAIEALPLRPAAFNVLLPADLKITGPEVDPQRVRRYLHTAFRRASMLGGEVIVFGSGRARMIPDGFPREKAWDQLVRFVRWAGHEAQAAGMQLVIEPLNRRECNIINSVAEAQELAAAASHPAVHVLADFYHLMVEDEPLANIIAANGKLAHVHVADTDRRPPGTGSYPYPEFMRALKHFGYDQRISIECRWEDLASECQAALEFLRHSWIYS